MERLVVWDCECGTENSTNADQKFMPKCAECGRVYTWLEGAWLASVRYELTLDDDGNVDFDAYFPDLPEPDFDEFYRQSLPGDDDPGD